MNPFVCSPAQPSASLAGPRGLRRVRLTAWAGLLAGLLAWAPTAQPQVWAAASTADTAPAQDVPSNDHWLALAHSYELLACPPDLRHFMTRLRNECAAQVQGRQKRAQAGDSLAQVPCAKSLLPEWWFSDVEESMHLDASKRLQELPHAVIHFSKGAAGARDKTSEGTKRLSRLQEIASGPYLNFTRFLLITAEESGDNNADDRLAQVRNLLRTKLGVPEGQIDRPLKWLLAKTADALRYPVFDQPVQGEPKDLTRTVYIIRIDCR